MSFSGRLVVPGRVQDQFPEQLAGGGIDNPDVQILDEEHHVGSRVGFTDPDVMEPAVVADGDRTGVVDPVPANPAVRVGDLAPCGGPGTGPVVRLGCCVLGQGAMRTTSVVHVDEAIQKTPHLGSPAQADPALASARCRGIDGRAPSKSRCYLRTPWIKVAEDGAHRVAHV